MDKIPPLDVNEHETLKRALKYFMHDWAEANTRTEAFRQAEAFGIEEFYHLVLSNYLAFFQKPMLFTSHWPNFDFCFSYGSLLDVTSDEADLLVLSTSNTFDFERLPKRAMNLRIAEREGSEYIQSVYAQSFPSRKKRLEPEDLVFVPSRWSSGLTYCFVPVFRPNAGLEYDVDSQDVRRGMQAVLEYLLKQADSTTHAFQRVMLQALGQGRLQLDGGANISELWDVLQTMGKARDLQTKSLVNRINLRVFSPRTVFFFLDQFVRDHEHLERVIQLSAGAMGAGRTDSLKGIIANNPIMKQAFDDAQRTANSDGTLLLFGAAGSGKETIARYIHRVGRRSYRPFVYVNCSESIKNSFDSEFFGYRAEGRTGAVRDWPGRLDDAADGTLYLDEISDLPLPLQSKLLRMLENHEYLPLRSNKAKKFKARVVVSTTKDLSIEVREGRFRKDLYFKLSGDQIRVPELTEHIDDLPECLDSFMCDQAMEMHRPAKKWAAGAISALMNYRWPGNMDELRQFVVAMLSTVEEETITLEHVQSFAPTRIASFLCTADTRPKSLRDLRPEQFWYEYITVYKSRGKDMASAYGVTEAAISQHKTKHKDFRPR